MKPIDEILKQAFELAIGKAFGMEVVTDPLIKTADPKHADYQSNIAMALGKKVGHPPRKVAEMIIENLSAGEVCETPTIAGPGFINIRLRKEFLAAALNEAFGTASAVRAGVDVVDVPQTVVIDYSGPNVAKQMHVGHLRTTILGDTLSRIFEFLGHNVVRQNHIGDFGTQFGMIIHHMRTTGLADKPFAIEDLDRIYKEATERFKTDPAFAEIARKTVVDLQSGEPEATALWNRMRVVTHEHYTEIYKLLGVTLTDDHERGESFYGSRLPLIVERVKKTLDLAGEGTSVSAHSGTSDDTIDEPFDHSPPVESEGLPQTQDNSRRVAEATEAAEPELITKAFAAYSGGAFCVFLPGYVGKDKHPVPVMLQKRDGGYPYSATDLAALFFRVQENKATVAEQKPLSKDWHADRVIYLTDARQSQHFAMVFDAFRAAQWDRNPASGNHVSLEHAAFGSILGEDGKPIKTKSGESVKLKELLTEAMERAGGIKAERGVELSPEKRAIVNRAVGIGAVKYADQKQDRNTDYKFVWNQMLTFEGNTGPYLQMQYTRPRSIYRKSGMTPEQVRQMKPRLILEHANELALAKKMLQFGSVVQSVARDLKPHLLCTYLYELAGEFSRFFENCPVLIAPTEELKLSRLLLCDMAATVLRIGLQDLLGIEVLEEM